MPTMMGFPIGKIIAGLHTILNRKTEMEMEGLEFLIL
jgi:hypothetical protein